MPIPAPGGPISQMTPVSAVNGTEQIPCIYPNVIANYVLTPVQVQTWLQGQIWPVSAGGTGTATASAHTVFAGPSSGGAAAPAFRTLAFSELTGTVTYAQLQNETGLTLLGNPTSGAAAPSEITLGPGLSFAGGALDVIAISPDLDTIGSTQGDTLFRGASVWQALAPGTVNQVLTSAGPSANPFWGISPIVAALIYG